jgi:hypothetical protein
MVAVGCAIVVALSRHTGARVFAGLDAVVCCVLAWRMWLIGTYVEPSAVRVVNYLRTIRVPWAEIEHFAALPAGQYPYVGHIIRKQGRAPVVMMGIESSPDESEENRRRVQAAIDPLNRALEEWRQRGNPVVANAPAAT